MANRSLVYSVHGTEPRVRDLGEHNHLTPLLHYLLVGFGPRIVPSRIWDGRHAIEGEAAPARSMVERFLEWMEKREPDAGEACRAALGVLHSARHQGTHFLLEAAEVHALASEDPPEAVQKDVQLARTLVEQVGKTLESEELPEGVHWALSDAVASWEQDLGLFFSDCLSVHLG